MIFICKNHIKAHRKLIKIDFLYSKIVFHSKN